MFFRKSRTVIIHVMVGFVAVAWPGVIVAQTKGETVNLTTITTDTGAFAPGRIDFSRYTTPAECLAAGENARDIAERSIAAQALNAVAPAGTEQTDGDVVMTTIAKACGTKFTLATTKANELQSLFELAISMQDDSLAAAVMNLRLTNLVTGTTRAGLISEMMGAYLSARPARVKPVEKFVTSGVLGTSADEQLQTMMIWGQLLRHAALSFDRAHMRMYAEQMLTVGHQITDVHSLQTAIFPIRYAYSQLAAIAFIDHPDSLPAIAQRAKADLSRIPVVAPSMSDPYPTDYKQMTVDSIMGILSPVGLAQRQVTQGAPIAPLDATYWFPQPIKPGKVTLILSFAVWWANVRDVRSGRGEIWRTDCLDKTYAFLFVCGEPAAWIRQWTQKYGSQLAIAVVTRTQGSALNSLALSPQQEAERYNWYFREHLKLPITVAVVDIPFTQRPSPDERRSRCHIEAYWAQQGLLCPDSLLPPITRQYLQSPVTLLGPRGELLYAGELSPLFDLVFAKAMEATSATRSAGFSSSVKDTL